MLATQPAQQAPTGEQEEAPSAPCPYRWLAWAGGAALAIGLLLALAAVAAM